MNSHSGDRQWGQRLLRDHGAGAGASKERAVAQKHSDFVLWSRLDLSHLPSLFLSLPGGPLHSP